MSGNRSFQGLGFSADAARRFDDLARSVTTLEGDLATAQEAIKAATALATTSGTSSPSASVLNITNAIGRAAYPQQAAIPKVTALPPIGSDLAYGGSLVDLNGSLYLFNATTNQWEPVGIAIFEDTHANRLANYPASAYGLGTVFFENDNKVFLLNELVPPVTGVNTWVPRWACPLNDTRLAMASYFSAWWPSGMSYEQNDSKLIYVSANSAISPCTVAGGVNVTFTGIGTPFDAKLAQYAILVSGAPVQVLSVTSGTALILASPVTNGVGLTVTVIGGRWIYQSGTWEGLYSQRPTPNGNDLGLSFLSLDLGITQVLQATPALTWVYGSGIARGALVTMLGMGLSANSGPVRFEEVDFGHVHIWNGATWQFSDSDPGSGWVVESDSPPNGGHWQLCDGGTYACMNGDGSTSPHQTQDTTVLAAIYTGGFQQAVVAAVNPTLSGSTDASAPGGSTGPDSATQTVQSGSGATVPAEPHTHLETSTTHTHGLTAASINPGHPSYYKVTKYMRL